MRLVAAEELEVSGSYPPGVWMVFEVYGSLFCIWYSLWVFRSSRLVAHTKGPCFGLYI